MNSFDKLKNDIMPLLSRKLSDILLRIDPKKLEQLEEIRLRADKPLMLQNYRTDMYVGEDGTVGALPDKAVIVRQEEILRTMELLSENSVYAYQEAIRNGYITIRGGHRIGISGRVVTEDGSVKNIKDISGLNIRISRQVLGCSEHIIRQLVDANSRVFNTLVISPPQCGKTTMLRDIARILSDGCPKLDIKGMKVGIVDERSELAACYKGIAQNSVGIRTDVLDGCPKGLGMSMMIRSMSPRVIITDEIGNEGDREAVTSVLNAGIKIVTSAHGYNVTELKSRREVLKLLEERIFERYVVLDSSNGPGTVVEIIEGITMKPVSGRW